MGAVIGVTAGIALIAGGAILTMTGIGAVIGIPMMAAGVGVLYGGLTHGRAFYDKPWRAIRSYSEGGLDYVYSWLKGGNPPPVVKHTSDGAVIYNSDFSNGRGALGYNTGFVSHLDTGVARSTVLHEGGHTKENATSRNNFPWAGGLSGEIDADIKAGTFSYAQTLFLLALLTGDGNRALIEPLVLYNLAISSGGAFYELLVAYSFATSYRLIR